MFRFWKWRRHRNKELDEELQSHLQMAIRDRMDRGETPQDARRSARREFGNVELIKEVTRDTWGWIWFESLQQDLRYSFRTLLRNPALATVAMLSLALGIGANAAVFTLIDAILLQRLPVSKPSELVTITTADFRGSGLISFPMFRDLREHQRVLTDMLATASLPRRLTITSEGRSTDLDNMLVSTVSGNYFDVLGVQPQIGRFFIDTDDRHPNSSDQSGSLVVLSDAFWERQFGRDPAILGHTILIGRSPCTVIGVAPRGFSGVTVGQPTVAWVPVIPFNPPQNIENRRGRFTSYMARLKPGVTREQAQAAMTVLFQELVQSEGIFRERIRENQVVLGAGGTGLSLDLRRTYTTPLWIIMVIVALVLLIASANVANLLLARAASRRGEISLRLAMGCSRPRLIRQLLTESMLLSVLGAIAGIVVAFLGVRSLVRLIDATNPLQLDLTPNWHVLTFFAVITLLTGIGFGLLPALRGSRHDLAPTLNDAGRGAIGGVLRQRAGRGLVALQVALSLVLLVGAGLLIQTMTNLNRLDWGFEPANVVGFDILHNPRNREPAALAQIARQVREAVQQVPGIESSSVASLRLFSGADMYMAALINGEKSRAHFNMVSPGYFETVGMRVIQGRAFQERDNESAAPVAVINESMARQYFPNGALGRTFQLALGPPPPAPQLPPGPPIEIVGVIRDAKYNDLRKEGGPMFYRPIAQHPQPLDSIEVRTHQPLSVIAPAVRRAVLGTSKDLMVSRAATLSEQVNQTLAAEWMILQLSGFFGVLALLLACVGLYGVMSYAIAQRTGEFGIRIALGASSKTIRSQIFSESLSVVMIGVIVGIPLAWVSTQLLTKFLYGITATDPQTIVFATLVLLCAAVFAAFIPANRAARVDSMVALRNE
jgi:predicted permease